MGKFSQTDANGEVVHVGDTVRVVGIPDLSGMAMSGRKETHSVFAHIVGTYKMIQAFDNEGLAELSFRIRQGKNKGHHFVWIEPFLLKIKKTGLRL